MRPAPRQLALRGVGAGLLLLVGVAIGAGGGRPAPHPDPTRTHGRAGAGQLGATGRSASLPGVGEPTGAARQRATAAAWAEAARRAGAVATVPVVTGVAPVLLSIPRIGVSARFERLGLNPDGTMQVPQRAETVGWYAPGAAPGDPGRVPAIVAGHVDSTTGPAVFYRLRELLPGDLVEVRRADRSTAAFVVERTERMAKRDIRSLWLDNPGGRPALRLVTCAGWFDHRSRSYRDNLIVYAHRKA